jgi:hypothetical protein
MNHLTHVTKDNQLVLLIGFHHQETMIELIAHLALKGQIRVIVSGNRFDVHHLARILRRQTTQVDAVLGQINLARPFTCYQVITLFEQTAVLPQPLIVTDLLSTFCDENVAVTESYRLLQIVISHLRRLRQHAPVVVSLAVPPQPERVGLVALLEAIADHVLLPVESTEPKPMRLF